MGIIGTTVKIGIPSGVLYYSFREGLWNRPDDESFLKSRQMLKKTASDAEQSVKPYVEPLLSGVKLPSMSWLNKFEPVGWWNCAVRTSCKAIVDFEPVQTLDNLVDKFNSYTKPPPPPPPSSPPAQT